MTDQLAPPAPSTVEGPEPAPARRVDLPRLLATATGYWRPEWRFPLVAYVIPVTLTILATTRWFSPGRFFAFLDIPPFVRDSLGNEVMSSWNHQSTGAGSTGAPMLQLPEVVLQRAVHLVGLDAAVAQWLLYALCFGLCTFGAGYLAGTWVRRPVAVLVAGLLATFNMYLLVWLPNPLPALAIGLAGVLAGMVGRAAAGRRIRPVVFAVATIPCSYVAQNPPWLVMTVAAALFVAVASGVVGGRRAMRRAWWLLVRALPWVVLLNLWWTVPLARQLLNPTGVALSAVTNVRDWSWTHGRSTLAGVLTLNADWAWTVPRLFPFTYTLSNGMRLHVQWIPPLLALTGLVLAGPRRRLVAWLVAGTGLGIVFVSTGLRVRHIWKVNLWLYDHFPGMWLLRDPASKLGVALVLIYSALAAIAVDRVIELAPRVVSRVTLPWWLPPGVARVLPLAAVAGLVVITLGNISPMWTGSVAARQSHGEYPSARVAVPAAWHRLADTVNAEPGSDKVLVLPVSMDSYNVTTTWGYHGVDDVPAQLLTRPTLNPLPGGYYDDVPAVKQLIYAGQRALLAGDAATWLGTLRALGVGDVVVRHDLRPASFDPPLSADPAALDAALGGMVAVQRTGDYGVASLYRVSGQFGSVAVNGQLVGVQGPDATAVAAATAVLPAGSVAVTDPTVPVTAFHGTAAGSGTMSFTLAAAGPYRLERGGTDAAYRVAVADRDLVLSDADTVAVDGQPLPARPPLRVPVSDPRVLGLAVDGEFRVLPPGGDVVTAGAGSTVTAYAAAPGTGLSGPFRPAPECAGYAAGPSGTDPLRLSALGGKVCTVAPVQLTGEGVYQLHFSVRTSGGAQAHVCLWEDGPATCAPLPAPARGSGWVDYTAVTGFAADVISARLYLYADAATEPGVAEFRAVQLTPLHTVGAVTVPAVEPLSDTEPLSAGRHRVTVTRESAAPVTTGPPEFVQCYDPRVARDRYPMAGRVPSLSRGNLALVTKGYGQCLQPEYTPPVVAGATYRFAVDYQTSYGEDPTVCVREVSTQRCLAAPAIRAQTTWQHVETLVRPLPTSGGLTPQLSATASLKIQSKVTYGHYSLTRVAPVQINVSPEVPVPAADTRVESRRVSPTDYQVRVHGASGRQVLVLPESFAPGWAASGLPAGWVARHLTVNGFANGWQLEGTGDATFDLVYRPAVWSTLAAAASGAGLVAVLLVVIVRYGLRLRGRRRSARLSTGTTDMTKEI